MATMGGDREHRDRDRGMHHAGQLQVHPQRGKDQYGGGSDMYGSGSYGGGPTASQVIAVVTLLPVSGTLLGLAGITFLGTLLGLAVTTPLFLLFSPILVPAALTLGLAVMAFLSSGAFGLTGLSALSWVVNCFRGVAGKGLPEQVDYAKQRMMDMAAYTGQKTKEAGQTIQQKAQESGGRTNY